MKPDLSEDQIADLLERVLGSPPVNVLRLREGRPARPIPAVLVWGPAGPTAIHQTPIDWTNGFGVFDAEGRAPFGTWLGCLREVGRRAAQPLRDIVGGDAEILLQRYAALIERCPEDRTLIHRDFGSNNVITDGTQITAVLDWDAAGCGDPLYDVGTALFWRTWLRCFAQLYEHFSMRFSHLPAYGARVFAYALAAGFGEVASCAAEGDGRAGEWASRRCVQLLGET